ncbi:MAG: pentapeptide repeat-containing protein [Acidimicrobiales bacterium]|nr:pentapeptide repeat-containing protein [Acidimicrobiales bacterium]
MRKRAFALAVPLLLVAVLYVIWPAPAAAASCVPGPGAQLQSCGLAGADLADADLAGANFALANLTGANLTGANLSFAELPLVTPMRRTPSSGERRGVTPHVPTARTANERGTCKHDL